MSILYDMRSGTLVKSKLYSNGLLLKDTLAFNPLSLFTGGKQGVWFDPSDLTTLFKDAAGTQPVTVDGDPVGGMLDKSGNGNHATQTVSASRPKYTATGLMLDKVDDTLLISVAAEPWIGTQIIATDVGTIACSVNIPAGTHKIGKELEGNKLVGALIVNKLLTATEQNNVIADFVSKGAKASYGDVINFTNYWRGQAHITSFPLIDIAKALSLAATWYQCRGLTSFPLIDTSKATNFSNTWYQCASLTSFPLIDVSSGVSFGNAWRGCSSLLSFPALNLAQATTLDFAWEGCVSLVSFPLITISKAITMAGAWANCTSLANFPPNVFDSVKGGSFANAFTGTNLTQSSIDGILASLVASGIATGTRVFNQSGGSAPSAVGKAAIDTLRARGWTVTVTGGY